MVGMLTDMDVHEVRVNELVRRAEVAIPTLYYHFRSLNSLVAEASIVMLEAFTSPIDVAVQEMHEALNTDDRDRFAVAATGFAAMMWTAEANDAVHRVAPLIMHFRKIAPDDLRLRASQARQVAHQIEVLTLAQAKGWIDPTDDVYAFIIIHGTCVLGQAVYWHPSFGALTEIDFSSGIGRLKMRTSLSSDVRFMPLR